MKSVKIGPSELETIAPYDAVNFLKAVGRVGRHPKFESLLKVAFPDRSPAEYVDRFHRLQTVSEFQTEFIDVYLRRLELQSSSGITLEGVGNIQRDSPYLFISNHRDIILDSALLTDLLLRIGYRTPQICLGDNLLADPLVRDLVKMNKGITVKRGLAPRELLHSSRMLSGYIRKIIDSNTDSVWIAQAEGRSKDGGDQTHPGVLKMLALSGGLDFIENLRSLHIIPVAVSYEYDSSDVEKALELFGRSRDPKYQKHSGDDLSAIVRGFTEWKGRINLAIGTEIGPILDEAKNLPTKPNQVKWVTDALDRNIRSLFKNFPSHYIASDLLLRSDRWNKYYTHSERHAFMTRLDGRLSRLGLSAPTTDEVKTRVFQMYARTVV